ncbi:SRPBCC family protein [Brevibacillus parabrevis]|uniref:SRPBCC family protein n=1 Tax=Brevibacillus parabrevis TaxID=54914 RepID=UPI0011341AB4|nr:SRPBCC family protein [Brevibacillus parabrevis]TGV22094.1 cell division protein [Mesorhizobium sp. M00.F.Ca.ET.186.01.1.1]
MPVIRMEFTIQAPQRICFDAARSIDLHMESTARTREKAIGGVTSGLIKLGESVTWEAVHFGIKQNLTAKITEMEEPRYFVDEMVKGAFKRFRHTHEFVVLGENSTKMLDIFDYSSPFGIVGKVFDWLVLEAYMTRFLRTRNEYIKEVAEAKAQELQHIAKKSQE